MISPPFDYAVVILDKNNITLTYDLQIMQDKTAKVILDFPSYALSFDAAKILGCQLYIDA